MDQSEVDDKSGENASMVTTDSESAVGDNSSESLSDHFHIDLTFKRDVDHLAPRVCYALAHNKIPFVESLVITNLNASVTKKISVKVSGEWAIGSRSPIKEFEFTLDAPKVGESVEISPVHQIQLDDIALAELEELAPANLLLTVLDDLGRIQTVKYEIEVYARDQWLSNPQFSVVTASFIQPNHPDVNKILARASEILRNANRSGLSGYQEADSGQHHYIASAIYKALQEKIDNYINEPASYEELGQKLRPIDRVLDERQGTCIDLACAFASCLEQAGLFPVIFLVKGHAFCGYLTIETALSASVIDSWEAIQSYIDSGLVVGVETVGLTMDMPFDQAMTAVQRHLNPQRMQALLDVSRAHREGVRPLPARILRDNVVTLVIDNGPSSPPVIERRDSVTRKLLPDSVPARVQAWKSSLLDLSFRNRLLNLKPERYGITLVPPVGHLGWIEDRLNEGAPLLVGAHDSLNALQVEIAQRGGASQLPLEMQIEALKNAGTIFSTTETTKFKRTISRLKSSALLDEEESGANSLYLTLGSVKWANNYGDYKSPLFLVPIRITKLQGLSAVFIEIDASQSTTVNYCLIEALRVREQLALQWFGDDMSDDSGLDIEAGLEALRVEFRETGLDMRGFSVDQDASIAILDFKKFRLWKDLNDHWKDFVKSPVVKHLVETPRQVFQDPESQKIDDVKVTESSVVAIQPADGSQISAIEKALGGVSFVLQGPPGSGKSQTITNLLANAMYRGKKVLFVAEKEAALNEVQERLDQVNLTPYYLALHGRGTKPEKLSEQLRDALDQSPRIDERVHHQFEDEFAAVAQQLDDYRRNVYGVNKAGFSFAKAFFRIGELGDGPIIDIPREFLEQDENFVQELQRNLLRLDDMTRAARVQKHNPWSLAGHISFESIKRDSLTSELRRVLDLAAILNDYQSTEAVEALNFASSLFELCSVSFVLNLHNDQVLPGFSDWIKISDDQWLGTVEKNLTRYSTSLRDVSSIMGDYLDLFRSPELSLKFTEIQEAASSFALGRKKKLRQALGPFGSVFDVDLLEPEHIVEGIQKVLEHQQLWSEVEAALVGLGGMRQLIKGIPLTQMEVEFVEKRAKEFAHVAASISAPGPFGNSIRSLVNGTPFLPPAFSQTLNDFVSTFSSLVNLLNSKDDLISKWSDDVGLLESIHSRSRNIWTEAIESGTFLTLQRWLSLAEFLEQFRIVGLSKMCLEIETGVLNAQEVPKAFERGLLWTTLKSQAEATNLDVFDSTGHNRRVRRFIELLNDRRINAQSVIPFYLFKSRAINAGVTTGKVGEFRREVSTPTKRRRGRSIRHLITRYPDIIADLTPCFLMSPDSVAQFIPPGSIEFDLVVFDEASQIVVADAIGAIGRAKSCIVVGDSKQMPPTKVAMLEANSSEEQVFNDNDESLIEEESILEEVVSAGFPQALLTWHYRSQDESLIAFSNEHYYDRKLSTFPAPSSFREDCGLFYRRVDGQFDHGKTRTNQIEAEAIVEELVKRLDDPELSELSYGIVTLNLQQRALIESLLTAHSHPKIVELRDREDPRTKLFVRNLENVQGRERDIIILGTSFSRRLGGGAMPLNFGPLMQSGGEKRLNVAVTRSKRQLVVVSSFDPEDMAEAKSLGLKHMYEFLKTARNRSNSEVDTVSSTTIQLPFLDLIAQRLEERGIVVQKGVGLSKFKVDMALSIPEYKDTWLVAVLFDGEEWSERLLAVDRDALPVTFLETVMGWPRVARVWMPAIRIEIDSIIDELVEEVYFAKQEKERKDEERKSLPRAPSHLLQALSAPSDMPPNSGTSASESSKASNPTVRSLPNEVPFQKYQFENLNPDPKLLMTIPAQKLLEGLIDTEGPIRATDALKRLAREFGLQRVTSAKLQELTALLSTREVSEIEDQLFVWPESTSNKNWLSVRRTTIDVRKIDEITPYEIANAMEEIVRLSISMSKDELIRWISQYFGAQKLSAKTEEYLSHCLAFALEDGRLILDDGQLLAGKSRFGL